MNNLPEVFRKYKTVVFFDVEMTGLCHKCRKKEEYKIEN